MPTRRYVALSVIANESKRGIDTIKQTALRLEIPVTKHRCELVGGKIKKVCCIAVSNSAKLYAELNRLKRVERGVKKDVDIPLEPQLQPPSKIEAREIRLAEIAKELFQMGVTKYTYESGNAEWEFVVRTGGSVKVV